jgi:hypothetical protein
MDLGAELCCPPSGGVLVCRIGITDKEVKQRVQLDSDRAQEDERTLGPRFIRVLMGRDQTLPNGRGGTETVVGPNGRTL